MSSSVFWVSDKQSFFNLYRCVSQPKGLQLIRMSFPFLENKLPWTTARDSCRCSRKNVSLYFPGVRYDTSTHVTALVLQRGRSCWTVTGQTVSKSDIWTGFLLPDAGCGVTRWLLLLTVLLWWWWSFPKGASVISSALVNRAHMWSLPPSRF